MGCAKEIPYIDERILARSAFCPTIFLLFFNIFTVNIGDGDSSLIRDLAKTLARAVKALHIANIANGKATKASEAISATASMTVQVELAKIPKILAGAGPCLSCRCCAHSQDLWRNHA